MDDACDQLSRFQWFAHILVSYSNIFRCQACFPALLAPKFYGGFSGWPTWDCQKPLPFLWLNRLVSGSLYIQYMYVYIYIYIVYDICVWVCVSVCTVVFLLVFFFFATLTVWRYHVQRKTNGIPFVYGDRPQSGKLPWWEATIWPWLYHIATW